MRTARTRRPLAVLAGLALAAGGAVSTLAIVAAPAGATTVSTEVEFRNAWANDSEITLAADIALTCGEGGDGEALRSNDTPFTLDGQGHTISQTCVGSRVLHAEDDDGGPGGGVVRNVTITGGTGTGQGGFPFGGGLLVDSDGPLTIDHAAIVGNSNCSDGGGLDYEGSSLTISHSTIADNVSGGAGGALWAGGAVQTVTNSTIAGNSAAFAGGILGDEVTLTYATVVQNGFATGIAPECVDDEPQEPAANGHTAHEASAAVEEGDAQIALANLAVAAGDPLTSFGSVVALPLGGETNCNHVPAETDSQGYNFSDDATCGFTGTGDRENAGDPGLGALGGNGGYAPTMVPQAGSPLLDAIPVDACQTGSAAGVTTDERDITRPQGIGCDIGAVEVVVEAALPLVVTPRFTG
jgi:hypothetical protein